MPTANAEVWVSADGTRRPITGMATQHIRNAIAMIEREVPQHYLSDKRMAMPVYQALKAELAERTKPRIVEAQGKGALGNYRVQWRVVDGVLQVRHLATSKPYGYPRPDAWKATSTLTRETLVKLINLYDSPNGPETI